MANEQLSPVRQEVAKGIFTPAIRDIATKIAEGRYDFGLGMDTLDQLMTTYFKETGITEPAVQMVCKTSILHGILSRTPSPENYKKGAKRFGEIFAHWYEKEGGSSSSFFYGVDAIKVNTGERVSKATGFTLKINPDVKTPSNYLDYKTLVSRILGL